MVLQRRVLHKCHSAVRAQVGPLSAVLPEVDAKGLGQGEPFPAVLALVGPFPGVSSGVLLEGAVSRVGLGTSGALELFHQFVSS